MRLVNVICRDAVRRGLLKSNPCAQLNRIKTRRARVSIPSEKQVEALIKRLRSPEPFASQEKTPEGRAKLDRRPDKRWSLLVEASAFSGLRAGELAGLQVRDIDFDNYTLTVARAVSIASRDVDAPKTEAALRDVDCLEPGLCKRLKKHVRGMRATDYVFGEIMADGVSRPYNHMNFYRRHFQPACEDLGVTTRFHDLRHFYASILIAEGEDLMNVARLLGHTSPGFTLSTYGHLIKRDNNGRGERQAARRAAARGEKRKEPKRPKGPKPGKRPF